MKKIDTDTKQYGIECILKDEQERSAFLSYCRKKVGITLQNLTMANWHIILPSLVEIRNQHKNRIEERAKSDKKFASFIAIRQPTHLNKAFETIQNYLSSEIQQLQCIEVNREDIERLSHRVIAIMDTMLQFMNATNKRLENLESLTQPQGKDHE